MKSINRKRVLKAAALLFLAICLTNYSQFATATDVCQRLGRVVTDEEIFASLLEGPISTGQIKFTSSDQSGREYLKNHPGCCHIDRGWWGRFQQSGLLEVFFGRKKYIVGLRYEMSDSSKKRHGVADGSSTTHVGVLADVDTCGQVLRWSEE
jgi:hypothetical protein